MWKKAVGVLLVLGMFVLAWPHTLAARTAEISSIVVNGSRGRVRIYIIAEGKVSYTLVGSGPSSLVIEVHPAVLARGGVSVPGIPNDLVRSAAVSRAGEGRVQVSLSFAQEVRFDLSGGGHGVTISLSPRDAVVARTVRPSPTAVASAARGEVEYEDLGALPEASPSPIARSTPKQAPSPIAKSTPEPPPTPIAKSTPKPPPTPIARSTPKQAPSPIAKSTPEPPPTPIARSTPKQAPSPRARLLKAVTLRVEAAEKPAPQTRPSRRPHSATAIRTAVPKPSSTKALRPTPLPSKTPPSLVRGQGRANGRTAAPSPPAQRAPAGQASRRTAASGTRTATTFQGQQPAVAPQAASASLGCEPTPIREVTTIGLSTATLGTDPGLQLLSTFAIRQSSPSVAGCGAYLQVTSASGQRYLRHAQAEHRILLAALTWTRNLRSSPTMSVQSQLAMLFPEVMRAIQAQAQRLLKQSRNKQSGNQRSGHIHRGHEHQGHEPARRATRPRGCARPAGLSRVPQLTGSTL